MTSPVTSALRFWRRRWWKPAPEALALAMRGTPAAIVTGASEGIGLAFVRQLAARGHTVVAIARREDVLREACRTVGKEAPVSRVLPLPLDLTAADAIDRIDEFLTFNGLYADLVVNNAGFGLSGPVESQSEVDIAGLLDLNIRALTLVTRRVLPGMLVRGEGGIINVASLGGYVPGPFQACYYASKAYVISLSEALSEEVAGRGVRVLVVSPGPVDTGFHARMGSDFALYRWLVPAATPESIARKALSSFDWGRSASAPGLVNASLSVLLRILPHTMTIPLVGRLLDPRSAWGKPDAGHR
jgi:short-subunit dehydrogenase